MGNSVDLFLHCLPRLICPKTSFTLMSTYTEMKFCLKGLGKSHSKMCLLVQRKSTKHPGNDCGHFICMVFL